MGVNIKKEFGFQPGYRRPDLTSLVYGKIPPQVPEIERCLIGAMLTDSDHRDEVLSLIPSPECFYVDAHQKIYNAIRNLALKGSAIDLIIVTEELRKSGELELVGGAYYLTDLTSSVTTSAHAVPHCLIVLEKHFSREMIKIAGKTIGDAYEDATDVFELINTTSAAIDGIMEFKNNRSAAYIKKFALQSLKRINELRYSDLDFTGVPTGFRKLNQLTNGWQKPELIIIGARPSVGKTAFALNLAWNAAEDPTAPTPTAIFSLEMGGMKISDRFIAKVAGVPMERIKKPKDLTDDDYTKLLAAGERLSKSKIIIDDTPALSIIDFRARARRLVKRDDVGLIIIDYLQLMKGGGGPKEIREQEIARISSTLKAVSKELEIPIIALSQLNRESASSDRAPRLSDLRESGAIEQDADTIIFLYRPTNDMLKDNPSLSNKICVDIAKNRDGATDDCLLVFDKSLQQFSDDEPVFISGTMPVATLPHPNPHKSFEHVTRNFYEPRKKEDEEELPF